MISLTAVEEVIDASGIAPQIEGMPPAACDLGSWRSGPSRRA